MLNSSLTLSSKILEAFARSLPVSFNLCSTKCISPDINHKQFYYRSDPSDSASNTFMEMLDLIDGYGWVIDHRIGYINGSPCIRVVRN